MKNNKITGIIVVVVVVILAIGAFFVFGQKKQEPAAKQQTAQPLEEGELLPTVDPSVKVDLASGGSQKEAVLTIDNIPNGTESIDYELSYQEKTKGLQGVIGTITVNGEKTYEKKLTLGTCSSGRCVYHVVEGAIKVTLKFSINGEQRLFEKDYDI